MVDQKIHRALGNTNGVEHVSSPGKNGGQNTHFKLQCTVCMKGQSICTSVLYIEGESKISYQGVLDGKKRSSIKTVAYHAGACW